MMTGPVETWQRPLWTPSGDRTRHHLIAFFAEECPEFEVIAREDGLPEGDPLAAFELEAYTDPNWLAGWTAGRLEHLLHTTPHLPADALKNAKAAMGAWALKPDLRTHMHLQAAMGLARAFARVGAIAVLDVVALRWWRPADLLALQPDRAFDIAEHVVFNTSDVLAHTLGMAKFARPDVAVPAIHGHLLDPMARQLADGALEPEPPANFHFVKHPNDAGSELPVFFNPWLELRPGSGATLLAPPS